MASMLWQTSFIVRALSPLSLDHAFRHLRLLLHLNNGDLQLNPCSFSSHDYLLQTLCLFLLRAAAATTTSSTLSPFFVAFPESFNTISLVYPTSRKMEMEHTVKHVLTSFPEIKVDSMSDDEFGCGLAMQNALLGGLAAALVCDGWIVFDGNLAVHGGITDWIDGTPTEAIAFAVHNEQNDCIDFLISPDVIRIRRFKIERFLLGPLKNLFNDGAVVILHNYLENMSPENVQELDCLTLPSLKKGIVSGFCKSVPKDFTLDKHKEIWMTKHGLVLSGEEFYIQVSFPYEENMQVLWFPSCLVLRSCGLIPALPNIRTAKIHSILQKVTSSISGWDFFNSGKLKLKSILQRGTQSLFWTTANLTLQASQIKLNDKNVELDLTSNVSNLVAEILQNFRRPRLPSSHYAGSEITEHSISDRHGVDDLRTSGHSIYSIKPRVPSKLGVPVFSKRKIRGQIPGARKAEGEINSQKENLKICTEQGKGLSKKPPGSNSKSIAGVTAVILPMNKRVYAEQQKIIDKKLGVTNIKSIAGESSEGCSPLKKKKAPDCSQPSYQKLEMFSEGSVDTQKSVIKSITCVKQPPQDRSLLANDSIIQQEQQSTSKTKGHNAENAAACGGKKLGKGEKKTIDSETNQKKILSKHAAGKLSGLTVPELKVFLSENKAKVSGKKEELVQRVVQLLSSLKPP